MIFDQVSDVQMQAAANFWWRHDGGVPGSPTVSPPGSTCSAGGRRAV